MSAAVTDRCDTVATKCHSVTVAKPYTTRTCAATVTHRCDIPNPRARTGAHARGNTLFTIGAVATVWDGKGSLVEFIVSQNRYRRDLTKTQKAVLGVELKPLYAEEARKRQLETLKRGDKTPVPPEVAEREEGEATEQAAKAAGVSARYVYQAEAVKKAKGVLALADAARVYGRRMEVSLENQNYAAEISLRAERRLGEIVKKGPKATGTRGQLRGQSSGGATVAPPEKTVPSLTELGVDKHLAKRARIFALAQKCAKGKASEHAAKAVASSKDLFTPDSEGAHE